MELPVLPLTPAAFAPFGRVVAAPDGAADADGPGWRWWGETALLESADGRSWGVGCLALEPAAPRVDWAERHLRSAELVVPGGDCLVYVGPPDHPDEPARLPPLADFHVFLVPAGHGVLIAPGVWHGAPLAVDRPLSALVLLLEGTGRLDTTVVRFPETPIDIAQRGA